MTTSKRFQPATDDSPPAPCIECKTSLGNRDDCVQCSACGSWTCIACLMGCTKAVTETKKKDASRVLGCAGVVYTCKKCQESSDPVTADSYAALLKIVTANSQQIASLSEMIANLTIQVAAQKVVGNQRQLQQQQPFDMAQVVLAASQAASETIMEQMELKEKKSNLVCVGWKEDTTLAWDNEQNERDRVIIDRLCDQLRIKKELVVKNFRDGPKHYHGSHDRKDRIMKVVFSDSTARQMFLTGASSLMAGDAEVKNGKFRAFVRPDQTAKQRKVDRDLRIELKARKDAGELDIYIRRGEIMSRRGGGSGN